MTYKQQTRNNYPQELDAMEQRIFYIHGFQKEKALLDVRRRAEDFLKDIPSGRELRREKMLIAAHIGTLGHLLAAMLKLPLDGYWNFVFDRGCYSVSGSGRRLRDYTES
ncbi:MAG: histidine phosphatase family protein [Anaerobutyricum soehngenii]